MGNVGSQDRCEVVVECSEVAGKAVEERKLRFGIVADAEVVIRSSAQPSIHFSTVDFAASPSVGMVGIGMRAADEIREVICRVSYALRIKVSEASLRATRPWQPAQEVVEAAILHHHDNDMLDAGSGRIGKLCKRDCNRRPGLCVNYCGGMAAAADAVAARRRKSLRLMLI